MKFYIDTEQVSEQEFNNYKQRMLNLHNQCVIKHILNIEKRILPYQNFYEVFMKED